MEDKVAIEYYQTTNPLVQVSDGTQYKFITRANICLAWVASEHKDEILSKTKQCCGGNRKRVFRESHAAHIRRWSSGGGR